MTVIVKYLGVEAICEHYKWTSSVMAIADALNDTRDPSGPDPADGHVDNAAADRAVEKLTGVKIISLDTFVVDPDLDY